MAQNGLDTDIQFLPGVGPKRASLLKKELAVETVGQLLRLYPFRYIDRSSFVRICDIRPDMAYIQIRAVVLRSEIIDSKRLSVWISDGTGELETVFFTGMKWMSEKLQPGTEFIFFGKPTAFNSRINLVHPEVDSIPAADTPQTNSAATMTGVYPSTEKLKNGGITGKVMSKLMEAALAKGLGYMEESLPEYIMKQHGLVPLHFALRNIHLFEAGPNTALPCTRSGTRSTAVMKPFPSHSQELRKESSQR